MPTTTNKIRKFIARAFSRLPFVAKMAAKRSLAALSLLGICAGCSEPLAPIEVNFEVRFDGTPIDCAAAPDGAALTDLRFYVHNLALIQTERRHSVTLTPDSRWQDEHVALIDLEDGDGACENGSPPMNTQVRGTVASVAAAGAATLEFRIGVPPAVNHADPVTAPPPRNYSIMHWHWRTGYKFMRAGVAYRGDAAWLHLGSARCRGTVTDIQGCDAPNRPTVKLANFNPKTDVVVVDVARLFGPTGLGDGEVWSCESGPDEQHCRVVFSELGIDFETGAAAGPAPAIYRRKLR